MPFIEPTVEPDLLADPADIGVFLGDTSLDLTRAKLMVQVATAIVQQAAGNQRIVEVIDDTVSVDLDPGDHGRYLYLPQSPVTAVASVTLNGNVLTDTVPQLTKGRIFWRYGWHNVMSVNYISPSLVSVVYSHGYPGGSQDLQFARAATLGLIRGAWEAPGGQTSVRIDDYMATWDVMTARLEASPALKEALRRKYARSRHSVKLTVSE